MIEQFFYNKIAFWLYYLSNFEIAAFQLFVCTAISMSLRLATISKKKFIFVTTLLKSTLKIHFNCGVFNLVMYKLSL